MDKILSDISIDAICRLCLIPREFMEKIQYSGENSKILKQIESCLSLQIVNTQEHPQNICQICKFKIYEYDSFKNKCLQNEEILNDFLKKRKLDSIVIKNEKPQEKITICSPEDAEENSNLIHHESQETVEQFKHEPPEDIIDEEIPPQMPFIDMEIQQGYDNVEKNVYLDVNSVPYYHEMNYEPSPSTMPFFSPPCRQYECSTCQRKFKTFQSLEHHIKVHHNERNQQPPNELAFKCSICPKSFKSLHHLNRHSRKHSGEKPYVCKDCGKTFSQSENLRRHEKIHSDDRPFKCPVSACERSFIQAVNLKTHMLKHEKDNRCNMTGVRN